NDIVERLKDSLARIEREQIGSSRLARTLQIFLERHVEALEDEKFPFYVALNRGGDEVGILRFARGIKAHDVRMPLQALEELLLHWKARVAPLAPAPRENLYDDPPAEAGFRIAPSFHAEVGLRRAPRADLDRHSARIEQERVRARSHCTRLPDA